MNQSMNPIVRRTLRRLRQVRGEVYRMAVIWSVVRNRCWARR